MKNFIIDTNVLLQDPNAIYNFEEHTVIIPIGVIEELDKKKTNPDDLGFNSRTVSRQLDEFRKRGDLRAGVPISEHLPEGGKVRVIYNGNLGTYRKENDVDFHVLHVAEQIKKAEPENECIVVSRDINVRLKANALGMESEDYDANKVCESVLLDEGFREIDVDRARYAAVALQNVVGVSVMFDDDDCPFPNCYLLVRGPDEKQELLAKISPCGTMVEVLPDLPTSLKISSKNKEQAFALDALLDPDVDLVCLVGKAGSGKTLLAVAAAVHQVEDRSYFEKILISRPIMPMGKDIGFLPGDIDEKLDPWMKPIYDSLEVIHRENKAEGKPNNNKSQKAKVLDGKKIAEQSGKIFIESLTHIRGRSIHRQFVIIDEAQNLSPLEIKTIITRAGDGTKIVLTGDVEQIDNPYVDSKSNGLSVVLEAFRDSGVGAHIILRDGVRSRLSEEATRRL
jgi:PhoH-like ATPase